jgi:hypothetical protein
MSSGEKSGAKARRFLITAIGRKLATHSTNKADQTNPAAFLKGYRMVIA